MESRGLEDSKNVKTSQAYFFEGFISFFEDFSLTMKLSIQIGNAISGYVCFTLTEFTISDSVTELGSIQTGRVSVTMTA